MPDFDALRFDIELAIKLDTFVPRSKPDRSEWAEYVSQKIAERLRQHWEKHKPGHTVGPSGKREPLRGSTVSLAGVSAG